MTITDRREINPKVMMGKPVFKGTRIPVELILRKCSEGATPEDLLDAYPRLSGGYSRCHGVRCRYVGGRRDDYCCASEKAREAIIDAFSKFPTELSYLSFPFVRHSAFILRLRRRHKSFE
jgi:Protein of unknown function (DUF433)